MLGGEDTDSGESESSLIIQVKADKMSNTESQAKSSISKTVAVTGKLKPITQLPPHLSFRNLCTKTNNSCLVVGVLLFKGGFYSSNPDFTRIVAIVVIVLLPTAAVPFLKYFAKNKKQQQEIKENVVKTGGLISPRSQELGKMRTEFRKKPQELTKNSRTNSLDQSKHNSFEDQVKKLEKFYNLEFEKKIDELEKLIEEVKINSKRFPDFFKKAVIIHEQKLAELRDSSDYTEQSRIYKEIKKLICLPLKDNNIAFFDEYYIEITRKYLKDLEERINFSEGVDLLRIAENSLEETNSIYDYQQMLVAMEEAITSADKAIQNLKTTKAFLKLSSSIKDFVSEILETIEAEFDLWEPEENEDNEVLSKDKEKLIGKAGVLFWKLQKLDAEAKERLEEEKKISFYPDKATCIYMETQGELFDKLVPHLINEYSGKYIHFENGKILDFDDDRSSLVKRVLPRNINKQVFIEKVPLSLHDKDKSIR